LGEKILGSQPALGSQVELGDFVSKSKPRCTSCFIAFRFLKWFNNQEGTAGYVMVSATNERDVKLVRSE
jgi:hypothetical protein